MKLSKILRSVIVALLLSITFEVTTAHEDVPIPILTGLEEDGGNLPISLPAPTSSPAARITLMFTGDINLGRCIAKAAIITNDFTYPFHLVADTLRSADLTIGSLDGTISDQSPPMSCPDSMNLIGPQNMVQGLQLAGFDVISVATNHSKDCGAKGFRCGDHALLDTIDNLANAQILAVGGGQNLGESRRPVVIKTRGIRVAFLAVNEIDERVWAAEDRPGSAPLAESMIEQIKSDIVSAKKVADIVIVLPQWGIEYAAQPEETQRAWAREFLEAGASLVIGNGPHIVQPLEVFPGGIAFYALGNFVFDQGQDFRRQGVVLEATFVGDELESWQLLPIHINYFTYQPDWVDGPEAEKILERAAPLSQ